ncbi:hypothetical protein [Streptomyces sp. NPDC048256]|uniref:RapZ C-terminal domain-containing protein n=1 Tax=Streptomyces sp. NPDC048256 TaxID=3154613 RepID=UPI003405472D
MPPIHPIWFGYLHLPTGPDGSPIPPTADRIEDVRDRLRDPAAAHNIPRPRRLNPRVQDVVLGPPGARELLANLADYTTLPAGPRRIAIGCAGGRHRGVDRTTEGTPGVSATPGSRYSFVERVDHATSRRRQEVPTGTPSAAAGEHQGNVRCS